LTLFADATAGSGAGSGATASAIGGFISLARNGTGTTTVNGNILGFAAGFAPYRRREQSVGPVPAQSEYHLQCRNFSTSPVPST